MGDKLYGASGNRVFSIKMDGTAFEVIHQGTLGDGFSPSSGLTLVGSFLYGASQSGGDFNQGMIYAIPIEVPEPGSIVLAMFAATALAAAAWRRKRAKAA